MNSSRRKFLKRSGLATGGAMMATLPLEVLAAKSRIWRPNDNIRVGVIGCKGMGWSNMKAFFTLENIECVALADVDENILRERAGNASEIQGKKPDTYVDYRELLDRKDIDFVIIGTPDHWHCRIMVDACDAGKDVYVEKPAANSIAECYQMENAARKYDKIVQVGQWQRSGPHFYDAYEYLKNGVLGNIRLVKAWAYMGWMKSIPVKPNSAPPEGVHYDRWLGPAPDRPFNPNRFHFTFRWFWDYAGGLMTDWGVHLIDIALMYMEAGRPKSVMASGGKLAYPDDAQETPDTLQAVYEFDGFNMLWEHGVGISLGPYGRNHGIAFIGNNGTLVIDRKGWEVIPENQPEDEKLEAVPFTPVQGNALHMHAANFIEALKQRNASLLNCPIQTGTNTAINAHMGNVAFRSGEKVYWNEAKRMFTSKKANAYIKPEYHHGIEFPNVNL